MTAVNWTAGLVLGAYLVHMVARWEHRLTGGANVVDEPQRETVIDLRPGGRTVYLNSAFDRHWSDMMNQQRLVHYRQAIREFKAQGLNGLPRHMAAMRQVFPDYP